MGLGGPANGYPRQDGFDIVAGYTRGQKPIRATGLKAHGAMTVLLKDALAPNLVQSLENSPAMIHRGPFANIAHGCNSVIATRAALKLADYVVTEAGFGADLGTKKFVDIKCRKSGLRPAAAVFVATVRALKYHGGVEVADLAREKVAALRTGIVNLERHVDNVRDRFGLPCVVSINHRAEDTDAEIQELQERAAIRSLQAAGYAHYPVCVAKTQYSFSTDPKLRAAPSGHVVNIRVVRLAAGAEFIVMICGDIMTMPGLPKVPASTAIDLDERGNIVGMF